MIRHRIHAFREFVKHFVRYLLFVREILFGLLILLVIGALAISYSENLPLDQALYFTFITGLSIGYGDIAPQSGWGRLISVGVGVVGMIFTGITVAVATRALTDATHERIEHES